MTQDKNQKHPKKEGKKQTGPVGPDGSAVSLGQEILSTFDDIDEELDELLSRSKAMGYELAKKYRQKSGQ